MWSDWKQKIKEFADDITSPQFIDEEEDEEGRAERRRREGDEDAADDDDLPIRLPGVPAVGASPSSVRPTTDCDPTAAVASASALTHGRQRDDPSRRLEFTVERGTAPPPPPEASVEAHSSASASPAVSATRTTQADATGEDDSAPSPVSVSPAMVSAAGSPHSSTHNTPNAHGRTAELVDALQQRVASLEAEKADIEARVAEYQEQVRASHDETVAYYERLQQQREAEFLQEAAKEKTARMAEVEACKQQIASAESARQASEARVKALEEALEAKSTSAPEQPMSSTAITEEAMRQAEEDNKQLRAEIAKLQSEVAAMRTPAFTQADTAALDDKVADLEAQLAAAERRHVELTQQNTEYSAALEERQQKLTLEQKEAVARLQVQLAAAEQRASALQSSLDAAQEEIARHASEETAQADALPLQTEDSRLADLSSRLEAAEARASKAEADLRIAQENIESLRASTAAQLEASKAALTREWEARLATVQGDKLTIQHRLEATQRELDALEHARQEEKNRASAAGDASLAELRAMHSKLETDMRHQETLTQQLEATVEEALRRADVDLPSRGRTRYALSDLVAVLTSEFSRLVEEQDKAEQVLQEWEDTYEKAKDVNESLNEQLSEAWRSNGVLQEQLSTAEHAQQQAQLTAQGLQARLSECERALMEERRQRQELSDEKSSWVRRISETESGVAGQQEMLRALEEEVQSSHALIAEREEELAVARRSVENLQLALDSFKQNRARDVEERTGDLRAELEELRAQLADMEQSGDFGRRRGTSESYAGGDNSNNRNSSGNGPANEHLIQQLAAKNLEVTALHGKLQELRRMLEDTAKQLSGETMIDKGVASHLMVNYIHAFVGHRKEADEMLKVMSGLLGWDDELQEKAGLLPGPMNPHPPEAKGRRGFFSLGRRGPANAAASPGQGGGGSRDNNTNAVARGSAGVKKPSLAALWVDFLMKESADDNNNNKRTTKADAEGTDEAKASSEPVATTAASSTDASPEAPAPVKYETIEPSPVS